MSKAKDEIWYVIESIKELLHFYILPFLYFLHFWNKSMVLFRLKEYFILIVLQSEVLLQIRHFQYSKRKFLTRIQTLTDLI